MEDGLEQGPQEQSDTIHAGTAPFGVRIIALVFVFLGTHAIVRFLGGLFIEAFYFSLAMACLPIGLGLLRLNHGHREWAFTALAFGILGSLVGMAIICFVDIDGTYVYGHYVETPKAALLAVSALLLLANLWMWRVLSRPQVRELFEAGRHRRRRLDNASRFHVAAVMVAALVISGSSLWINWLEHPEDETRSTGMRDGSVWSVSHGMRYGKLKYVVFNGTREGGGLASIVSVSSSPPGRKVSLEVPGRKSIRLPSKHQLYEYIDGEFRTSDARVTREQFEAFKDSGPEEYTLDALLSFVGEEHRPR